MGNASKKPLAFSYRRWSRTHQGYGSSESRQTAELDSFCDQHGLQLSEKSFTDAGVSGFTGSNSSEGSELHAFLNAVKEGVIPKGSWLLIDSFDRLTRLPLGSAQKLVADILSNDISIGVLSTGESFHQEDANDFSKHIRVALALDIAYQESKTRSRRSAGSWDKVRKEARSGKVNSIKGGICPGWLKKLEDGYEVKAGVSELIGRIFNMYNLHGLGSTAIATRLNTEGIVSFSGIPWSSRSVSKLLTSYAVKGIWRPKRTFHENGKRKLVPTGDELEIYPKIVSDEQWNLAQYIRSKKRVSIVRGDSGFRNAFQKIAFCGCGAPLRFNTRKNHSPSYLGRCNEYGQPCSYRRSILVSDFEYIVLDTLVNEDVVKSLMEHSVDGTNQSLVEQAEANYLAAEQEYKTKQKVFLKYEANEAFQDFYANQVNQAFKQYKLCEEELERMKAEQADVSSITEDMRFISKLIERLDVNADNPLKTDEERIALNQLLRRHFEKIVWEGTNGKLRLVMKHFDNEVVSQRTKLPSNWKRKPMKPRRDLTIKAISEYLE